MWYNNNGARERGESCRKTLVEAANHMGHQHNDSSSCARHFEETLGGHNFATDQGRLSVSFRSPTESLFLFLFLPAREATGGVGWAMRVRSGSTAQYTCLWSCISVRQLCRQDNTTEG